MRRLTAATLILMGCTADDLARPQWLIYVDQNLASAEHPFVDPESTDAVIDTLRIDVLTPGLEETREYTVLTEREWPVSIGIVPRDTEVVLRIRAFRAQDATTELIDGRRFSLPHTSTTIDRVVVLEGAPAGVEQRSVLLQGDCLNHPSQFGAEPTTCVGGEQVRATQHIAIVDARPTSRVGRWEGLSVTPCAGQVEGAVCIAGGFSVLGDRALAGFVSSYLFRDPTPLRPIRLSPFWIDRAEITVGRFRALVAAGRVTAALPKAADPTDPFDRYCTWLGVDADANDALPLNCLSRSTARATCQALGGALPTEAQWEHAARGRGRGRTFPWGDDVPSCCRVSANRGTLCPGEGVSTAGAYAEGCDGTGDVTSDGVWDMAGNVGEIVEGVVAPYDDACWGLHGVTLDPLCVAGEADPVGVRGGDFGSGLDVTALPLRAEDTLDPNPAIGFRCVYRGVP